MSSQKTLAIVANAITNLLIILTLIPLAAILPTVADYFGVDALLAGWVQTAYLLTLTSFLLISGRLGDLYGHRRVFIVGAVLLTIVGTAAGFVQDIGQLIVLRSLQGLGAALVSGNSLAIISNTFTAKERGMAIGIAGMAASLGGVLGVVISTFLAEYLNWQWLFYLTLPLGLLAIRAAWALKIDFRPAEPPKIDYLGSLLLALTLTAFSLSFSHLHEGATDSFAGFSYHGGLLLATGGGLLLFVLAESRAPQPIIRFGYLRNGPFSFSIIANEILHMAMMSSNFLIPFLLQSGMGLSPIYTAGVLICNQTGNIIASPLSGILYDRTRWRFFCPMAMTFVFLGLGAMAIFAPILPYPGLMVVGLVLGTGLGFFNTPNNTIIMSSTEPHLRGFAAGMLETSRQLGHTLGISISSAVMGMALMDGAMGASHGAAYVTGYQYAALAATGFAFLGILCSLVPALAGKTSTERATGLVKVS